MKYTGQTPRERKLVAYKRWYLGLRFYSLYHSHKDSLPPTSLKKRSSLGAVEWRWFGHDRGGSSIFYFFKQNYKKSFLHEGGSLGYVGFSFPLKNNPLIHLLVFLSLLRLPPIISSFLCDSFVHMQLNYIYNVTYICGIHNTLHNMVDDIWYFSCPLEPMTRPTQIFHLIKNFCMGVTVRTRWIFMIHQINRRRN